MRRVAVFLAALALSVSPTIARDLHAQPLRDQLTILESSRDRDALTRAAVDVASSGDRAALVKLGSWLGTAEFLARLDDLATASFKTAHLRLVFDALAAHPNAATEQLCVTLASDPKFLADDDRRIYLLPALVAVTPMAERTTEIVKRANADGYYALTAPLLVKNRSPRALALFEEMIRDRAVPVDRRVDALHSSILPWRATLAVLDSAGRLLAAPLDDQVVVGVIESVFQDRTTGWFGMSGSAPRPPSWESAPRDALQRVLSLAVQIRGRKLPPDLAAAVTRTTSAVRRVLAGAR